MVMGQSIFNTFYKYLKLLEKSLFANLELLRFGSIPIFKRGLELGIIWLMLGMGQLDMLDVTQTHSQIRDLFQQPVEVSR
jgi:hypothetical protein